MNYYIYSSVILFVVLLVLMVMSFLSVCEGFHHEKKPKHLWSWNMFFMSHQHPKEFPLKHLTEYYCIDFQQCQRLFQKKKRLPFPRSYIDDLYTIWKKLPMAYKKPQRRVMWYPRDRVESFDVPVLVKTRPIHEHGMSVLFRLNTIRHFQKMRTVISNKHIEPSFHQKKNCLVWRGAPTGFGFGNNIPFRTVSRQTLVEKYFSHPDVLIDVGLVLKPNHFPRYAKFAHYSKHELSLNDMLECKYILSVEGNDVASNLKWVMCSQSLVVAPRPQIESWFLESRLQPYVHYLPVRDDFSDLEQQIEWAQNNPSRCEEIIQNANTYAQTFLDEEKQTHELVQVLSSYLDTYVWV